MATLTRELIQDIPHALHLDEAIDEVFRLMMGVLCEPVQDRTDQMKQPDEDPEMLTAVIGLAGAISGACVLCSGGQAALRIAEFLVGVRPAELDDTVKDAVGEVCNMIAGAWKGKYAALASGCMLSTPAVVTGTNYQLHMQRPEFRVDRQYRFEEHVLSLSIVCDSIQ